MSGFNLSALAVRERAVTLFLIIAISVAGLFAFLKLGRAEDPTFTDQGDDLRHGLARRHRAGDAGPGRRAAREADAGAAHGTTGPRPSRAPASPSPRSR